MNDFRRLAAKLDQHMQLLSSQGVNDAHAIINRMMGYVPDLHKIWTETSDDQLITLSHEFPGFYRYARIMEDASKAESNKTSRPYDGMTKFPEQYRQLGVQLLATAATLERGYHVSWKRPASLSAASRRAGQVASAMALRSGKLHQLSTCAGSRPQGIGVCE